MSTTQLFAPESYTGARRAIRAAAVNGCGTAGWKGDLVPETIYGLKITSACNIHDWMYGVGETLADKNEADRVFLNNLLRLIDGGLKWGWLRALRRRRALKYYNAVKWLGGAAFWADKNKDKTQISAQVAEILEGDRDEV